MVITWNLNVEINQIRKSDFFMEMKVEEEIEEVTFWVIFVHASTDARDRRR